MIFITSDEIKLSGIFGLISITIAWFYGLIVLYKFIKTREKMLFYFFFAIIFTMAPWYPSGLGFIFWLFTRKELAYQVYVLLGTIGTPIALYSWLQIYMPALHPEWKKQISLIIICLSIIFYIYLFYFVFFAPG
ncbi:MAG: hypothetical protein ACFFFT_15700, partial [Candidatus Thorarchaeota archaeon]